MTPQTKKLTDAVFIQPTTLKKKFCLWVKIWKNYIYSIYYIYYLISTYTLYNPIIINNISILSNYHELNENKQLCNIC